MKNIHLMKRVEKIQEQLNPNTNIFVVSMQSGDHIAYPCSALPIQAELSQRPDVEGAPGKVALSLEEYKTIAIEGRDFLVHLVPPDEE